MVKMKRMRNSDAGFTLVEIAIVMVIIGLLIGGILKGQELIKNAKTKKVMKQVDELRVAVTSYQDRYGFLPGDDNAAQTHTGDGTVTNGNGSGQISGGEAADVFDHVSAAGFISGTFDGTNATLPRNPFGGLYRVYWRSAGTPARTTHWFESQDIPGDIGLILDTSYDDGSNLTGSITANRVYTSAIVTLWVEF